MRRALALGVVLLAGCGGGDEPEPKLPGPQKGSAEERAIRGWSEALNRGDYDEAAGFFARGALVEQVRSLRLRDHEAAREFNRSLPCRAEVTDVKREGGTLVAAFKLRAGTGPPRSCGGDARVRFRFRDGKFSEWRQLAEPSEEEGDVI
ncbi:MAG: nuclear transport factor 2 family protein [Actinomycetota bacterium]|nr:nuclear transport factor 2 family protein [Actinomycetota bacterium]MDQ3719886.1 nuclear transport factor 2 family protein [Actinomycetota bacterium]